MKNELAEQILAKTMNWNPAELKNELELLQMMSSLKYDEYQQYTNGKQFVESLALWLRRFPQEDRQKAYEFVKENIIFISERELQQLISVVYEEFLKPKLIKKARDHAAEIQFREMEPKEIYRYFLRKTLFLGLSDGAHMDYFRRSNNFLNNEQVFMHYDFSLEKYQDMLQDMRKDLLEKDRNADIDHENFNTFVLIDDFSGSGISYMRREVASSDVMWKGKICKFLESILDKCNSEECIDVHIVLYIATQTAIENIRKNIEAYIEEKGQKVRITVEMVQEIRAVESLKNFEAVLKHDFDTHKADEYVTFMDRHYKKGKTDKPYLGFNECSLGLVLYHNTPNNSFPVIWHNWIRKGTDMLEQREDALFPRVTRHKEN